MSRNILITQIAWEDYRYWQANDRKVTKRINELLKSILREGEGKGIGKPERLTGFLAGFSSRRINQEHRLVHRVHNENVEIIQCRYHYHP